MDPTIPKKTSEVSDSGIFIPGKQFYIEDARTIARGPLEKKQAIA